MKPSKSYLYHLTKNKECKSGESLTIQNTKEYLDDMLRSLGGGLNSGLFRVDIVIVSAFIAQKMRKMYSQVDVFF